MASNLSQDLIQSGRLVHRRYVRIPHDQIELLKRPDAWSDKLSAGPSGMLNVPDYVLEDVKKSHIRKHSENPPAPSSIEVVTADTSKPQQPIFISDASDDDEDVIPWSSSGAEDADDPAQEPVEEKVLETETLPELPVRHASKSPRILPRKDSRLQLPADVPSSSMANSDDLEIEPPGYLSQEIEFPVNREAFRPIASTRPEPTPPSAQIPVATVASTTQAAPANKEQRRMNEPANNSYDDVARNTAIAALGLSKWGCTDLDAHKRSSTTTTTSSLALPSDPQSLSSKTSQLRPPPLFAHPVDSKTKSSNLPPTWEGRHQASASPRLTNPDALAPAYGSVPPNAQPIPRGAPTDLTPYEEFKAAYPDYLETARTFVSGCLNVKQMMRDRTLPEFLYDDFIRAFSTDYMLYISKCNRKRAKTILTAVEWYNETTKDPKYLKKVIRKDNLVAVLELHADDVDGIRRSLGDSQSTESDSAIEDSDEGMQDASIEGEEEVEESDVEDAHKSQPSPELQAESPIAMRSQKAAQQSRDEPRTGRDERLASMDALTASSRANVRPESDLVDVRDSQTKVLAKQAIRPPSSPASHFKSPSSGKVADVRGQPGNSQPTAHNTPATARKPQYLSERTIPSSSGGSIDTISPVQRSQPRPFSSEQVPVEKPANGRTPIQSRSIEQQQKQKQEAPKVSSPLRNLTIDNVPSKKRPLLADDEDDDDNAFDPPVNDPMPPPPKRPARHLNGAQSRQASVYKPVVSTPPARRGRESFPSTMPAVTTAAAGQDPTFTPRGQGATASPSRPSTSAAAGERAGAQRGRSSSLFSDLNTANRGKKRMSEAPADRAKNFKEFLKRRSLGAGTPSSTPAGRK